MGESLVSIIIPIFNHGPYLSECVQSLIKQTYKNLEVIIVDDGSTDDTKEVISALRYEEKKSIIFISQDNAGPSSARNTGLKKAKGEFCIFLDADDYLPNTHIERMVSYMEANSNCGIAYSAGEYVGNQELILERDPVWRDLGEYDQLFNLVRYGNVILIHAALFRREILNRVGLFDPSLRYLEDWEFWLRCAREGLRFNYLKDIRVPYRIHLTNTTSSQEGLSLARIEVYGRLFTWNEFTPVQCGVIREKLVETYLGLSARYVLDGKKKMAIKYGLRAVGVHKMNVRSLVYVMGLVVIPKFLFQPILKKFIPTL